jgi:hypothetical protein
MPPISSNLVDQQGVDLLRAFILGELTGPQTFTQWQTAKFGDPGAPNAAPTADPDGDSASNLLEYLTQGDPLSANDPWALRVASTNGVVEMRWVSPLYRSVVIESTDSIPPDWKPVEGNYTRLSNGEGVIRDNRTSSARLFRARIIAP